MATSLESLVAKGESSTLELKRSTGSLREAMQSLCAFANGKGGRVIIGVTPKGELVGQQVSEQILHDIAAARERFEPPISIEVEAVRVSGDRSALVLSVPGLKDTVPFAYEGRAFECVGNTTRRMLQKRDEALLLERAHLLRAAVVLFGKMFMPDYEGPSRDQVGTKSALSRHQVEVREIASELRSLAELQRVSGRTDRTKFRDQVVAPLLETGMLQMTIPETPRSSRQQYRTTMAGRRLVQGES